MKTMRNSVILTGRPGTDPQMRTLENDKKMARFRFAVTQPHFDADRRLSSDTQWFNVVAWGKQADMIESLVHKGHRMMIHGTLHNNEWTNSDGEKQHSTEILVSGFSLLEEKNNNA